MNQLTIVTTATSIAGAISLIFLKEYISAIFKTYPPDIKKHVSFIKKSFSFALRYILPIAAIVVLMIITANVTKFFVLAVVINTAALLSNVIFELYFRLSDSTELHGLTLSNQDRIVNLMQKNADLFAGHSEFIKSLAENQRKLIDEVNLLKAKSID